MTQTTEKWTSLVLNKANFRIVWRYDGIPFFIFIFIFFVCLFLCLFFCLFRSHDKKNTCMRTIFITVMLIISKVSFWELLDISCFLSSQQLWGAETTAFENRFRGFTWFNMRLNSILDKYHETKMGEDVLKIIKCIKI